MTTNPMTRADVLAKVREHFSKPDAALSFQYGYGDDTADEDPDAFVCVYRKDEDPYSPVRCAMGVLIPDELYDPRMEATGASQLVGENPTWNNDNEYGDATGVYSLGHLFAADVTPEFLDAVQYAHDKTARAGGSVRDFLAALDEVKRARYT
jgi:hypothetical protein